MSKFGDMLKDTASGVAESLGLPAFRPKERKFNVTGKAGRHYEPYRMLVRYERKGPFYIQTGWLPDGKPRLERRYEHRMLHATKGLMVFSTSKPTCPLPNIARSKVYGPRSGAYVDHGRFVLPEGKRIENSAGEVLLRYYRLDKTKPDRRGGMHLETRKEVFRAPLAA